MFERYIPLLDPDTFSDVAFYQELERIGYRQVLLGGTGAADLPGLTLKLKEHTRLQVVLYPAGPDSLAPADVVLLPDVMNSNSHYARPFGSGSVATAMQVARRGLNFIPLAYFIMGNSTARWYFDAFWSRRRRSSSATPATRGWSATATSRSTTRTRRWRSTRA
ncbi:hypothetical protein [Nannocystis pusilla]|uniref:hypothetical protein n=1 Tax=Nannocystis pusilla TaxID=889268 RepID=UPI003B77A757